MGDVQLAHANARTRAHTSEGGALGVPPALALDPRSGEMLAVVGAHRAITSVVTGATRVRLNEACGVLSEWLKGSSSLSFRVSSFWEQHAIYKSGRGLAGGKAPAPDAGGMPNLGPFLGGKAIKNREAFLSRLNGGQGAARRG